MIDKAVDDFRIAVTSRVEKIESDVRSLRIETEKQAKILKSSQTSLNRVLA